MRFLKSVLALGAFFVAVVGLSACGSDVPSNSVANVAGNPVTLQAFNHWMYVAAAGNSAQSPGSPVIVPNDPPNFDKCVAQARKEIPQLAKTPAKSIRQQCQALFTSLSSQVMDFLVRAYWYQAVAHSQGVKVTDAEVQKQFQADKKQAYPTEAQFQAFLKQSGQTQEDVLYRVKVNLIYQRLIKKHTAKVTSAQIASYYNTHKSQFGTPETRNIRIVLTKTKAQADAAKAALEHGQSWKAVAKQYSTDSTTKNNGGLLTNVSKGQQDAALDQAAFSSPTGKVFGPIKGQFGYYVFQVDSIKKGTQQTLEQATPLIQQTLTQQAQTTATTAVDNAAKKAYLHQTTCRKQYSMADCKGYKAPKTSTLPGGATGGTGAGSAGGATGGTGAGSAGGATGGTGAGSAGGASTGTTSSSSR